MASEPANPLAAGDTAELYRAAIGPRGQDYYLRQFTRFDAAGKTGASWHWPAYWSTLNWFIYRKMWGQALAYLAVVLGMALLVFGVGKLLLDYADTTGLLLFLLLLTAAFVVPGLYANAWYYNFCNEKISAALRATQDVKEACALLAEQASSNKRFLGQASVNVALMAALAGVVTFLFNPAQDLMQLAQGPADKPAIPLLPEMAAGTQPVLAPAPVARPELAAATPPAEAAKEMPQEVAKDMAKDAPQEPPKPVAAPVEPAKVEAASAEAVPPALAGLTSDVKIENYLARLAQQAAPADASFEPKSYVSGEEFLYLGEPYRLEIEDHQRRPLVLNGGFRLSRAALPRAEAVFERWYRRQALRVMTERAEAYAASHGFTFNRIKITSARKRWGSCGHNGNLSFAWRLVMAPQPVIDYVVVHELAHLKHRNHSKRFWSKVASILPDFRQQEDWLEEHGSLLRLS